MTSNALLQIALYLSVVIALVKPLGAYRALVFDGVLAHPCASSGGWNA